MVKINQEIFNKAMEEARKIFGVDPAYFGEEGEREVYRQLERLGVNIDKLKNENNKV